MVTTTNVEPVEGTSSMWRDCGDCRRRGASGGQLHDYPTRFGDQHEVYGACRRCGAEHMLSNTTHGRFVQLGGVCAWERCRAQAAAMTDRTVVRRLLEPTPETEAASARASRIHARLRATVLQNYIEAHEAELNVAGLMLLWCCIHAFRREAR